MLPQQLFLSHSGIKVFELLGHITFTFANIEKDVSKHAIVMSKLHNNRITYSNDFILIRIT
ncbi:protein of unknown function [Legionella hackeliae]|uniref:Uncharacterized protein n=1 Tax=Legionella hackeliae TaxID=449 RepID=A0A0A8UN54_LEGHA|nr:protein of unknown function [Legionella hackeliae]